MRIPKLNFSRRKRKPSLLKNKLHSFFGAGGVDSHNDDDDDVTSPVDLHDWAKKETHCNICYDPYIADIRKKCMIICNNGHLCCESCFNNLTNNVDLGQVCHICREDLLQNPICNIPINDLSYKLYRESGVRKTYLREEFNRLDKLVKRLLKIGKFFDAEGKRQHEINIKKLHLKMYLILKEMNELEGKSTKDADDMIALYTNWLR